MLWYDLPLADSTWSLIFTSAEPKDPESKNEGPFLDTIPVKKLSRSEFLSSHRIAFGDVALPPSAAFNRGKPSTAPPKPQPVKTIVQTVSRSAMLPFNFPIAGFDTSKWVLTVDSNRLTNFKVKPDSSSPRRLFLDVDWKQGKTYTLSFLPGALSDFWGTENADTLGRVFNVLPDKQLGTLTLSLEKLRPGAHYILQILNGTQLEEERQFMAEGQDQKLVFDHLQVAAYTARLVEDSNGSGRWDSGDFRTKQQPELVFNKKLDALRANWELEVKFSTEESVNAKKPKQ